MKHVIIVLLLFVSILSGKSQKYSSFQIESADTLKVREKDTIRALLITIDTLSATRNAVWEYGYSVREKHNNTEGLYDPYFQVGFKYAEWFTHVYYLNSSKKPFRKGVIVWLSKELENKK